MSEISNKGNDNIIIQNVNDSTITVNANGEIKEIQKSLEAFLDFMKNEKIIQIQKAEKIYNIKEINEATFKEIIEPNTTIVDNKGANIKNQFNNSTFNNTTFN